VKADEDTNPEVCGDAGTGPEASSVVNPRSKTRVAVVVKQSVSTAAATGTAVKTAEKKRKTSPPPAVETPVIPTPSTREVESDEEEDDEAIDDPPVVEERTLRRSLSPATKRWRELVQKMTEDDLRQGVGAY
jgi:hypothetical protein